MTKVTSDVFKAIEVILFCSSEVDFPEYCYQGEFSINQTDIDKIDLDSIKKLENSIQQFLDEAGIENVDDYEETTGRSIVADAVYTGIGSGITFEKTAYYDHLRMCAKKHLGGLEHSGPYKGDDGKIYL